MATIGYVTVEEADEYVRTHRVSGDAVRENWESLSESDRAVYLQRSYEALEALPFRGRKYDIEQESAFPRCPYESVPTAVKYAQIENALTLADPGSVEEASFYEKLSRYGVQSYSIGNLSESSSDGSWGRAAMGASTLHSSEAMKMLQPFLTGGFRIG